MDHNAEPPKHAFVSKPKILEETNSAGLDSSEDYENYNSTSLNYDKTRVPVGIEIILGCLVRYNKSLNDIVLLDAGCGTGNYARALIDHVYHIEMVDRSPGMLEQASQKLRQFEDDGRIGIHHAEIDNMPLADASVDAVMVNQVLYHIEDDPDAGFPRLHQIFQEFARVLRPHGALVINTSGQTQLMKGFWYADLIPEAIELLQRRFAPLNLLEDILKDCGFAPNGRIVPTDSVLQGDGYFESSGPLSKEWRDGDSSWAMVTDQQLERVLSRVTQLKQDDDLQAYFDRMDAVRLAIGQTTFLLATAR